MKAYKFGLLCPKNQDHLNLLNQLFKEAQDYYYDLRRIENSFRTEKENLLHNLDLVGNLNTIESEISILKNELFLIEQEGKLARIKSSSQNDDVTIINNIKNIKEKINKKTKELFQARSSLFKDNKDRFDNLELNKRNLIKNFREYYSSAQQPICHSKIGLHFGTYNLIETAIEQASKVNKNKFLLSKKDNDCIGHQIQYHNGFYKTKTVNKQIYAVKEFFSFEDLLSPNNYCYLEKYDLSNVKKQKCILKWNLITRSKSTIIEFPVIIHRQIPLDAKIKNIQIIRKKFGSKITWELLFSVDDNAIINKTNNLNIMSLDIGWRSKHNGDFRIGTTYSQDSSIHEELILPKNIVDKFNKVNELKSIRDKEFNQIKDILMNYFSKIDKNNNVKEYAQHLSKYKSCAKLIKLFKFWKNNRFIDDEFMFAQFEKFIKHDKHLLDWECNQRRNAINSRKDYYFKLAYKISNNCTTLLLEDFNLVKSKMTQKKKIGDRKNNNDTARANLKLCSIGFFRELLINAIAKKGGKILLGPARDTSRKCHGCKTLLELDPFVTENVCENCGLVFDRDENASLNMYLNYCEQSIDWLPPGVARNPKTSKKSTTYKKTKTRKNPKQIIKPLSDLTLSQSSSQLADAPDGQ